MNGINETVETSGVRNKNAKQFLLEVVEHLRNLAKETDEVKKSEFFKQYLEIMSKFWKYSYHNQLLIVHQMRKASRVAGFRKWRELGRFVKKARHGRLMNARKRSQF